MLLLAPLLAGIARRDQNGAILKLSQPMKGRPRNGAASNIFKKRVNV
jgi:hypothetical protein